MLECECLAVGERVTDLLISHRPDNPLTFIINNLTKKRKTKSEHQKLLEIHKFERIPSYLFHLCFVGLESQGWGVFCVAIGMRN